MLAKLLTARRRATTTEVSADYPIEHFDTMSAQLAQTSTEELSTPTSELQQQVEQSIKNIYEDWLESGDTPVLLAERHILYLRRALGPVPHMFQSLDASQPWIIYWSTNSLAVLGHKLEDHLKREAAEKLLSFQNSSGGFGGGLGQLSHAASTYAAVLALTLVGDETRWAQIDRAAMYQWLMSLKQDDGSFVMHIGGERDTRAVYCVFTIASLLNITTAELTKGSAQWLRSCQTYEGGFGAVPWDEAHGGYSFCAVAALLLLGKSELLQCNIPQLTRWVSSRQMALEGGFSGRTGKLVDGCYSFWVGGISAALDIVLDREVINKASLENYILCCCQDEQYGGLRDKPGKGADFYHSNYVLLGLAITQSRFTMDKDVFGVDSRGDSGRMRINPVLSLPLGAGERMRDYFLSV